MTQAQVLRESVSAMRRGCWSLADLGRVVFLVRVARTAVHPPPY